MSQENDEFRRSLVAAMQAELERHASAVVAEVDRLREEGERERAELRAEIRALARNRTAELDSKQLKSIDKRIADAEARQTRRLDDVSASLEGVVAEAARPVLNDVRDEQANLVRRIEGLDGNLRRFDEQAARMVTYFNDVSQRVEQRQDELSDTLRDDVAAQITDLKRLVDENDSSVRRFQNEVGQSVSQKLNDAEDRFNDKLLAAESRMKEDAGQRIAEIDVHVGRVSSSLDETISVLNERIGGVDDEIVVAGRRIDAVERSVQGIDSSELDELRDKLSSAIGEATLVRIEMERMEKAANERSDELSVRVSEVESHLTDATMDVSAAVQLDRLEEVERALIELDPDKFVLKDGAQAISGAAAGGASLPAPPAVPNLPQPPPVAEEPVKNPPPTADERSDVDIAAIIAAAEGRANGDEDPS